MPDNIANQIAAGEVIQRPASAVKELLENAVDADATAIRLIVNDAGKSLVQVIDDGKGMSYRELIDGLKYGSPKKDNPKSLSKFGLGLKTASTGFCPPRLVRLLPIKTTVAIRYQSRNSPVVSMRRS